MRYALIALLLAATLAAEPTPAFVDSVVQKAMASSGMPAVSLAIVRHGTIVYEKAYGYRSLDPKLAATTATTFPIGSVSKQFLAATMVAMAREGMLSLERSLADRVLAGEIRMEDARAVANDLDSFASYAGKA